MHHPILNHDFAGRLMHEFVYTKSFYIGKYICLSLKKLTLWQEENQHCNCISVQGIVQLFHFGITNIFKIPSCLMVGGEKPQSSGW